MHILDYDEFNIYTSEADVVSYVEQLIEEGIELKEDAYDKCLVHFGENLRSLIDSIFVAE
jgi:hypothetical protein